MSSKLIVITGVSKGLGRAMTTYFLSHGHTVIGCARSQDIISDMKVQFASASDRCHLSVVDVSEDAQVEAWAKTALKVASPDIVINSVGVANMFAPIWQVSSAEFNQVIDTGLKSHASVMRHYLPDMINAGRGLLVNFTSMFGTQPLGCLAPYSAAKHGVEGLSNAVSQELPAPLCSVILDPGVVRSNMSDTVLPAEIATRLVPAHDWAQKACPFILTIDRSMNGQTLSIPKLVDLPCGCTIKDGTIIFQGIDY